jgi:phage shock protein PspC (stress-responsive transcriptional regulator)
MDNENKKRRRLYRDMENAKIAGICSGLSSYFDVDVLIFRLIFICLGFCSAGVLAYLVLWFAVPAAKTEQQRTEMNGNPLQIDDIEQKIKSGIHEVETKVRDFANKNAGNIRETTDEIASTATNIFSIIGKIIGLGLIFVSVCAIATFLLIWLVPIPSFFKIEQEYSIFFFF